MNRQREFTEGGGGCIIEPARFEPSPSPVEAEAQRKVPVDVAQHAQQPSHLGRALESDSYRFQRRDEFGFVCRH